MNFGFNSRKINRKKNFIELIQFLAYMFAVIAVLSWLFNLGPQIYPKWENGLNNFKDPECRNANNFNISVVDGELRFYIDSQSENPITFYQSWKLFRFFIHGQFYTEEIRPGEQKGIYTIAREPRDLLSVNYDIVQMGSFKYEAFCLDTKLNEGFLSVTNENIDHAKRKKSIILQYFDIETVCQSPTIDNIIFEYNNIHNTSNFIQKYSSTAFTSQTIEELLIQDKEYIQLQSCGLFEIYNENSYNIIKNVFISATITSRRTKNFGLNSPEELKNIQPYIEKIIGKGLVYSLTVDSRKFCWNKCIRYRTKYDDDEITKEDIIEMRNKLFGNQKINENVIVTNMDLNLNDNFEVIQLKNLSFIKKIEAVKNAHFLIISEYESDSILANLLPNESIAIIIQKLFSNKSGNEESISHSSIKLAIKSDCKIEIISEEEIQKTLSKYGLN